MDRQHCPPSTHGPSKERKETEKGTKSFETEKRTQNRMIRGGKVHIDKYMSKEKTGRDDWEGYVVHKETGKL